ncbi:ribosome biogenesis protein NOP53 [Drosophila takahashii]|uniref:ribosome biogenesis protein NOP53 n=1 Tax=Drosophila takahashii TaxID=29030 RepID=UPI001CF86A90|nr:ribosome biogenesis protein NOP53 [Drosophila takahashii]
MTAVEPATKRKRISKKNKSAWRKTDIQDVEQFLEDQRQEERIGTFTDKQDEDLFVLDASPEKSGKSAAVLSVKQRRKLNAKRPMRTYQALENTSKVQDPIAKRNHVRQKKNGRNIELEVCNPTKPRHRQANKDREQYYGKLEQRLADKRSKKLSVEKDIWQEVDFRDAIPGLKDKKGWISRDLALHTAGNIGKKVVKTHASLHHKTTKAKKFELPHPGMSYNPAPEDHLALISQIVEREEGIIKKEQHLKRVTTSMFSKVTPEERDRRRLQEMSQGMEEEGEQEKQEEEEDLDKPYHTVNAPVENKKKSKQARSKELKQKELARKTELKRKLKQQTADLIRIKSIRHELDDEAEDLNELKKRRKQRAEKAKFEPKRLGRHKFEAPDLDVNLPEDVAGNLRNVKTESSLLKDRFHTLQRNNMLPTTKLVSRKKAKVKRYERSTHKEPGVSYQDLKDRRRAAAAAAKAAADIKI